jgi:hypothetical protein
MKLGLGELQVRLKIKQGHKLLLWYETGEVSHLMQRRFKRLSRELGMTRVRKRFSNVEAWDEDYDGSPRTRRRSGEGVGRSRLRGPSRKDKKRGQGVKKESSEERCVGD